MKIIHLLQSNTFSGAENVVCQIIKMMDNNPKLEMVYCSLDGPISDVLKKNGIRFCKLEKFNIHNFRNILKREKPDIVHAHDMRASFIAGLACSSEKIISHIHNNNFDSRGLSLKSILYLIPATRATHIYYVSQSAFEGYYFHNLFAKKSSVLYNVIDAKSLVSKMHNDKNIYDYDVIFLGRLSKPKNPLRLMNVIKKAVEIKADLKVAVVGTGELEIVTKNKCREFVLENNVSFLGFMPNPAKVLHDSKLMIMTSLWEGTPMCALEAMSLGVPIVSTPTDGLKDLVSQGISGFLSDNDEELANFIVKITTDNKLREKMSLASIKRFYEINSINKYKEEILKVYEG